MWPNCTTCYPFDKDCLYKVMIILLQQHYHLSQSMNLLKFISTLNNDLFLRGYPLVPRDGFRLDINLQLRLAKIWYVVSHNYLFVTILPHHGLFQYIIVLRNFGWFRTCILPLDEGHGIIRGLPIVHWFKLPKTEEQRRQFRWLQNKSTCSGNLKERCCKENHEEKKHQLKQLT